MVQFDLPSDNVTCLNVFDLAGRQILQRKLSEQSRGSVNFNLADQSAGMYLVRLDTEHTSIFRKVIKQ